MRQDRPSVVRIVLFVVAATIGAAILLALVTALSGNRTRTTTTTTRTGADGATTWEQAASTGVPSRADLDAQLRVAKRPDAAVPRARTRAFDAGRALDLVRLQVAAGPRPAGSPALADVRRELVRRLPRARTERVAGHPGLVNVVGRIPGRSPAVVLAAHCDTQLLPEGFVGANDSAAGTAIVLEAARALSQRRRPAGARAVEFVLFDGEELPPGGREDRFADDGLRGSRAFAAAHRGEVGALALVDYSANRGLRLPRERSSDEVLWGRVRAAADRVGVGSIFAGTGLQIIDDHLPFLRQGVPAVDLIDWSYPQKNTAADTLDRLSENAIDATGETMVAWLDAERRR